MRRPCLLILLAILFLPLTAHAAIQQDPVGGAALDPNYADQAERERREQLRREEEERRAASPALRWLPSFTGPRSTTAC